MDLPPLRLRLKELLREHLGDRNSHHQLANAITASAHGQYSIDRKKLKQIFTEEDQSKLRLGVADLAAIHAFLVSKGKPGLTELPLFEPLYLFDRFLSGSHSPTIFLSKRSGQPGERRNYISAWDVQALSELLVGATGIRPGQAILVKDAPHALATSTDKEKAIAVLRATLADAGNVCSIGSPRASPLSNYMLSTMYGVRPFKPREELSPQVPYGFIWDESLSASPSEFDFSREVFKHYEFHDGEDSDRAQITRHGARGLILFRPPPDTTGTVYAARRDPMKKSSKMTDYGVICAKLNPDGRLWVVAQGVSGPGTLAACKALLTKQFAPGYNSTYPVYWFVRGIVEVKRSDREQDPEKRADHRHLSDFDARSAPVFWNSTKHMPVDANELDGS